MRFVKRELPFHSHNLSPFGTLREWNGSTYSEALPRAGLPTSCTRHEEGVLPYAYKSADLMARAHKVDLTRHECIELVSMGDLHTTSPHVDMDMIRSARDWLLEADNRYALVPGDVFDTAIKGSVSLDLSEMGMSAKDGRHLLHLILEPVRDRILAVISGNHDDRQSRDTGEDSVDALCMALGIPYFDEGEVFLRIAVGAYKGSDKGPVYFHGYMTHGNAGGRLPGSKANSLLAMRAIVHNADFYLNGHGHTPLVIPEVAWRFDDKGNVREQKQMFISCGSSLKRAGYPVKKGYPPLARVWPTLTLHGDGHKHMTATVEH